MKMIWGPACEKKKVSSISRHVAGLLLPHPPITQSSHTIYRAMDTFATLQ